MTRTDLPTCILSTLLVLLAACSGGAGSDASSSEPDPILVARSPSPVAGYWHGSATDVASGEVMNASAMIDETGDAQLMIFPAVLSLIDVPAGGVISATSASKAPFVIHGNVCCSAEFTRDVTSESFGAGLKTSTRINGHLESGMLVGEFAYSNLQYSFSLAAAPDYSQPLTMQDLAGVYSNNLVDVITGTTTNYTIAVNNDGVLTGQHYGGCIYNGTVSIPNTAHNLFRLQLELSGCNSPTGFGPRDGRYTGLGTLLRNVVFQDPESGFRQVFYYSAIGPVWLGTQGAAR